MKPEERDSWARHVQALRALSTEDLQIAFAGGRTDYPWVSEHNPVVKSILEERLLTRIGDLAERVECAVTDLTTSSDGLERLTKKLNSLTIILVVLTALAVVVPITVEVWHSYYPEKEHGPPVLFQLPPPRQPNVTSAPEDWRIDSVLATLSFG